MGFNYTQKQHKNLVYVIDFVPNPSARASRALLISIKIFTFWTSKMYLLDLYLVWPFQFVGLGMCYVADWSNLDQSEIFTKFEVKLLQLPKFGGYIVILG